MLGSDDYSAFRLALLLSAARYAYLKFAHDRLYAATNGWWNAYVVVLLMFFWLGTPWPVTLVAMAARVAYRHVLSDDVRTYEARWGWNHPQHVLTFFVWTFAVIRHGTRARSAAQSPRAPL